MNYAALRERIAGPLSVTECEVLAEVAAATSAQRALEVGHYLGLSTAVLLDALPADCELVTIDHHGGDAWCPPTSAGDFYENVEPLIGGRSFRFVNKDMVSALTDMSDRFGIVFYDADHTAAAVADFWDVAVPLLEERCTLIFDDADWAEQSTLRQLAEAKGFAAVTGRTFHRSRDDKRDPETYTLEVMERG